MSGPVPKKRSGTLPPDLLSEMERIRDLARDEDVFHPRRWGWLYSITSADGEGQVKCVFQDDITTALQMLIRGEPFDWDELSDSVYRYTAPDGATHWLHRIPLIGLIGIEEIVAIEQERRSKPRMSLSPVTSWYNPHRGFT